MNLEQQGLTPYLRGYAGEDMGDDPWTEVRPVSAGVYPSGCL